MKLRRSEIVLLGLLLALGAFGAGPAAAQKTAPKPFEPGEELIYKAEISRALLRKLDVASFRFTASRAPALQTTSTADGQGTAIDPPPNALRLTGDVSSQGFFIKLFNVHFHQHVESLVDAESLAVQKTVKLDEQGKRLRASEASFDQKNGKVVWTERDPNDPTRPVRNASFDFRGPVYDVVSAIYYVRSQQLEVGKSFEVPISDSGRVYRVPVRVMEKKRMKTVLGRVSVLGLNAELFGQRGMVNAKGQFLIWLTDDHRHIPVSAQLKSEYGTFDITLQKVLRQAARLE